MKNKKTFLVVFLFVLLFFTNDVVLAGIGLVQPGICNVTFKDKKSWIPDLAKTFMKLAQINAQPCITGAGMPVSYSNGFYAWGCRNSAGSGSTSCSANAVSNGCEANTCSDTTCWNDFVNAQGTKNCPIPIDGACGSSNGLAFLVKPATNLCSDGTLPTVSGTGSWSWTCAGVNGGKDASCSTKAIGTCAAVITPAPTQNYSCNGSDTVKVDRCEYDSTLSGGTNFNVPIFYVGACTGAACRGLNGVPTYTIAYRTGYEGFWIGFAANSSFNGSLSYYQDTICTQGRGSGVSVIVRDGITITAPIPICNKNTPFGYGSSSVLPGVNVPLSIGGYIASSSGTYGGSPTCKDKNHTLSADKKTCSYPAKKTYSCTNVCSAQFNNLKGDFDSIDETCDPTNIIPGSARNPVVDCDCGISTTKVNAPGVDYSSCASNLCIQSSTFNLTIGVDNAKVIDASNGIDHSIGSKTFQITSGGKVNLVATPNSKTKLNPWLGDACPGNTSDTCSFDMTKDFSASISSALITCPGDCATTDCGKPCQKTDCNNDGTGTKNCNKLKVNAWKEVAP